METVTLNAPTLAPLSSVVTIGVYDGVHRGHLRTLGRVIADARATGRHAVVATFDQHPAVVVNPERTPLLLSSLEQRLERLDDAGIDITAIIPFDEERANESAEEFVSNVVVHQLGAGRVVVGQDFRFGHGRLGDVALLEREGARLILDEIDGDPVSSTRIRFLIAQGEVRQAAALLGRLHEVRGVVVHGDGRGGSELGYPTANIHVPDTMAIPAVGIYAGWYRDAEHTRRPAAISVGRRPTFYEGADPLIEAYLIDFDGDLYGHEARLSFLEHLRDEIRFDSVDALIAQMGHDVEQAALLCREARDEAG